MPPVIKIVHIQWDAVAGATAYEIRKDGVVVSKAGSNARTSKISVGLASKIEVTDLPDRKKTQEFVFSQVVGT